MQRDRLREETGRERENKERESENKREKPTERIEAIKRL